MGNQFSEFSKEKLTSVDPILREILEIAIGVMDFRVIEGHRNKTRQDEMVEQGRSKLSYPNSKHNSLPSKAVDIAPYPIDWEDTDRFVLLAGIIKGIAYTRGIKIRWGGDWNDNNKFDQSFVDMPHFELVD